MVVEVGTEQMTEQSEAMVLTEQDGAEEEEAVVELLEIRVLD